MQKWSQSFKDAIKIKRLSFQPTLVEKVPQEWKVSLSSEVDCSSAESWSVVGKGEVNEDLFPDEMIVIKANATEMDFWHCLAFQSEDRLSVEKMSVQYQRAGKYRVFKCRLVVIWAKRDTAVNLFPVDVATTPFSAMWCSNAIHCNTVSGTVRYGTGLQ